MEDLDRPRCVPGADAEILRTLEWLGFEWDGPVIYQSARVQTYRAALEELRRRRVAYPCSCSRKEAGAAYPGTCRAGCAEPDKPVSWRVRVDAADPAAVQGDFVVLRSDGIFAYHLAVVVDDEAQGITDVVRGADLLDSTPPQIWLQRQLGFRTPRYVHVPVATNEAGEKLSKQNHAPALKENDAAKELARALRFLGRDAPDPGLLNDLKPGEILNWAVIRAAQAMSD